MKRKKAGVTLMITGAVLILSALLLLLYNRQEDRRAGQEVQMLLPEMQQAIAEAAGDGQQGDAEVTGYRQQDEELQEEAMKELELDGNLYIGVLSIPVLKLELPVITEWSYRRLRTAPCRQSGSPKTGDLVIAGHNYQHHFGRLSSLKAGDLIQFTDLEGQVYTYVTECVDEIQATDTEAVEDSQWELVLYTCTYGGGSRVMAGCRQLEEWEKENISNLTDGNS